MSNRSQPIVHHPLNIKRLGACTANDFPPTIPFGESTIDEFMFGIPGRGITEISGEASAGKTQTVLRLLASAQLNEEGKIQHKSVYISSEGDAPVKRLSEICDAFKVNYQLDDDVNLLDNIFIEHVDSPEDLWELIHNKLGILLAREPTIRLVVLDSIAAVFRSEFGHSMDELSNRKEWMFGLGSMIKRICDDCGCAFVAVNQISTGLDGKVKPALGLAWSSIVNTRFMLQKHESAMSIVNATYLHQENIAGSHNIVQPQDRSKITKKRKYIPPQTKRMSIVFSPMYPQSSCEYFIDTEGIRGIKG